MKGVTKLGNKEILARLELALNRQIQYGLSVEFDAGGNPVIMVAPVTKAKKSSLIKTTAAKISSKERGKNGYV